MGKEDKKEEKKEEKKEAEVFVVVYKMNLHCPQCAHDIRRPLSRTPGVHTVDVKYEKNEITVKGTIEAKKIHARLQKWSKKKVEIVSETKFVEKKEEKKDAKKETIKTIQMKVYIHCAECDRNLKRRLLRHKGIHNVKTDIKAQTVTIEGVVEQEKIITYMKKRIRKFAEVIPPKEKKEEKEEQKKEKVEVKITEKNS